MTYFQKRLKKELCADYLTELLQSKPAVHEKSSEVVPACKLSEIFDKSLRFRYNISINNTKEMPAKKRTFDIGELSSAIDKVVVQGSKVFINFSGNEKTYEYSWKPASSKLLAVLDGFVKNPESVSLGRFYNESLKGGDLVQITTIS